MTPEQQVCQSQQKRAKNRTPLVDFEAELKEANVHGYMTLSLT